MIISIIVALDENNGIGKDNQLLCYLPADLAYFKAQTMGKPIIMGHRTFQSIGKVLPGRRSIVLSRQDIIIPGAEVVHSFAEALQCCQEAPEVMIIGGSTIYEQAFPLAQRIYATYIHHHFDADVYFPTIDLTQWSYAELKHQAKDDRHAYDISFGIYTRAFIQNDRLSLTP